MQKDQEFVHLHVHTDYSLLDGCSRIDRLCERASELGMKALAITDHGNLFGLIDFFDNAKKHNIKPLLGCEIYLTYDHRMTEKPMKGMNKYHHMGLIAKNDIGYKNLTKLVSDANTKGFYYKPRTDMYELAQHSAGLIGFTGCLQGVVPQFLLHQEYEKARKAVGEFIEIFGKENYFVELHDHGLEEQRMIIPGLLKLATEFGLKVICSNDVHYVEASDWQAHDALLCIQTGAKIKDEKRLRYSTKEFYLKSREEMERIFKEYPQAVINTNAVAEMCDFKFKFGENHYPVFHLPIELKSQYERNVEYLKQLCYTGLSDRYGEKVDQELKDRVEYEISIIDKMGFVDYFLIVWDFIDWARKQAIPVGPGRGSGAGCLVAYVLKITDIDPIRFGLLFERFLNPERVSPPDFDIDFCMRRRNEVIEYVKQKYGKDSVANIITFGTFGAKMVIRDLARVRDVPYAEADRWSKMVPEDAGITLDEAIEKSKELATEIAHNSLAEEIVHQGRIIEGMVRNTGTHAAGVIISDQPLTNLIPVVLQEGVLTTQYPKDPVESLGLLKMDFLGLKTLTIISDAERSIRRIHDKHFDIEKISFEDKKTFELLNEARTVGVFQLESSGMQSLCKQFNISNIDEIIALVALYRPGPMDLIPDYIQGKKDPTTINYAHPLLEDICKETYGIMVYQEQVMEAARKIAGYTLGGADLLRRAMGKKKPEEMERQRTVFIEGAKKHNGISEEKASGIFDLLEKFAGYGFNKSHSAAYAILAYRTAYLKANYPVEFMSAVLSNELGNAEKVSHFIEECVAMGIAVLGPDINQSGINFTPILKHVEGADSHHVEEGEGGIRFGLGAIKGVGDAATEVILRERETNGDYHDYIDFVKRVDGRVVNKRVMESLIKCGGFDRMGYDRQHLLDSMESIMSEAASLSKDKQRGQTSLFDLMEGLGVEENGGYVHGERVKTEGPCMSKIELLKNEKELLGFYLSGHPLDLYDGLLEGVNSFIEKDFGRLNDREVFRLCGVVSNVTKRIAKKDNKLWAYFTLSTKTGSFQVNIYSDGYGKYGKYLEEGNLLIIVGMVRVNGGEVRLNASEVFLLEEHLGNLVKSLEWDIDMREEGAVLFLESFYGYTREYPGKVRVSIRLMGSGNGNEVLMADAGEDITCGVNIPRIQRLKSEYHCIRNVRLKAAPVGLT